MTGPPSTRPGWAGRAPRHGAPMTGDRIHDLAQLLLRDGYFSDQADAVLAAIRLLACAEQLADDGDLDVTPRAQRET